MRPLLRSVLTAILFSFVGLVMAQDCFDPPDGYTLFTTNNGNYSPPALTGFVTYTVDQSGDWSISGTSGSVAGNFLDNTGRTSTIEISGTGTLTIDCEVTDVSTNPHTITNCTQTFNVANYTSSIVANPELGVPCPIQVVVVMDESGSIADGNIDQALRDGILTFAQLLNNSGSTMAVVEFDSRAENVSIGGTTNLQIVDDNFLLNLNDYLTNDYQPSEDPLNLIGGTNWEDALTKAHAVPGATFILLMTDGNPTFYSFGQNMMGSISGEGDILDLTALKEAQSVANIIKASGKRIFVVGVDIPVNIQPIIDISGNSAFPLGGTREEFFASDYISVSSSEIQQIFERVGLFTCGAPIPTIGQWGLIVLGLLILIIGITAIKQTTVQEIA